MDWGVVSVYERPLAIQPYSLQLLLFVFHRLSTNCLYVFIWWVSIQWNTNKRPAFPCYQPSKWYCNGVWLFTSNLYIQFFSQFLTIETSHINRIIQTNDILFEQRYRFGIREIVCFHSIIVVMAGNIRKKPL